VVTPDLPYEDPATTYDDRVRPALEALGEVADPVIVGHSLGAGYAPLVAAARPAASLVYLCPAPAGPFAATEAPMRSTREGFAFPANRPDGTSVWDPDVAIAAIYPRLPAATAQMVAACLRPGASPADAYPLSTQPAVPTTFIYAKHDEFFAPDWSRWVAREVAGVEPIELDTGHFPMVEAPDALARLLV
jgi:pimeloyl-ACP methyl ester carboxylesterase